MTDVFPIDEPFGAHMSQLHRPLVIDQPREFPDIPAELLRDVPFVAVMEVPLVVGDRLVGVAALRVWEEGQGFTERQLRLALGIAQVGAVAIEHAQLYARAREPGMAEERNRLAREVHDALARRAAVSARTRRLHPVSGAASQARGPLWTVQREQTAEKHESSVLGLETLDDVPGLEVPDLIDDLHRALPTSDGVAGSPRRIRWYVVSCDRKQQIASGCSEGKCGRSQQL